MDQINALLTAITTLQLRFIFARKKDGKTKIIRKTSRTPRKKRLVRDNLLGEVQWIGKMDLNFIWIWLSLFLESFNSKLNWTTFLLIVEVMFTLIYSIISTNKPFSIAKCGTLKAPGSTADVECSDAGKKSSCTIRCSGATVGLIFKF